MTQQVNYNHVRALALSASRKYPPHLDRDDMIQEAYIAAWRAAESFDPGRGVAFEDHLACRIRFAICDYVRALQHSRRRGPKPRVESLSHPIPGTDSGVLGDTIADTTPPPDIDLRDGVAHELAQIDKRTRFVLEEHVMKDRLMRLVGDDLGVTEGRVSQMLSKTVGALRQRRVWQELAAA